MALIDKIKKMFGGGEVPDEVGRLYRDARSEREALIMLKEARRRDEARRKRAMQDIEVLDRMEGELLDEGKGEISDNRKLMLARRIKEIRYKIQELNGRIENIYNKRLKVFNEHVTSLETVLELSSEALPDKNTMEEMAIKAKNLIEELDKTKDLAEGIAMATEKPQIDSEEQEILREFEAESSEEEEPVKNVAKEELDKDRELEKEEIKIEKQKEKPKEKEKPVSEPPEIMFEE